MLFSIITLAALVSTAKAEDAVLKKGDVRPPIGWGVPTQVTPIWSGKRGEYPVDGQVSCPTGTIPLITGTADEIVGGAEAQFTLDWGRAWAVQPEGWNGDWAQAQITVTLGSRENAAAIWCIAPQSVQEFAAAAVAEAAPAYTPPPTVCQMVAGPSLYWDGLQVGESGVRSSTLTLVCNGQELPPPEQVELTLPGSQPGFELLQERVALHPNVPEEVLVRFTAPDTTPHTLNIAVNNGELFLEGQAQARPVPTSAAGFTPCEWGFGAHLGANASLQGLAGIGAGDIYVPVRTKKVRCDAFRLSAGWGITPDRDGETPLDQWQALGSVTSAYQLAGGYEWGWDDHLKRLEVGGQIVAVRVHPDASSDLYQAGPRVAWSPRFGGVVQMQVWGSPGLMWGYADSSATWSAAFGQPTIGSAWRFQPTLSGGLDLGLRF